jgi:NAD(P)-dependent dehydrogenase (short-subunit alcohol dehydrogenase family)
VFCAKYSYAAPMNTFSHTSSAADVVAGLDLGGRTIVITGVTSGIGTETARVCAAAGAHIVGTGRDHDATVAALNDVAGAGGVTAVACELSEPKRVRAAVDQIKAAGRVVDAIVANAGIMALPTLTVKHGLELQFLTNHLGHFIFVKGLLDQLATTGRVVMVSSMAHTSAPADGINLQNLDCHEGYTPFRAYGVSKLANVLFARSLAKRFGDGGRVACSLHPGVIRTNLTRHMGDRGEGIFARLGDAGMKSIGQGAATQTLLAVHPLGASANGQYWSDCQPATPSPAAQNDAALELLWAKSEALAASLLE